MIEPVEPQFICVPQYDPDFIFFRHHRGDHLVFGDVVHFGLNLRIGAWLDNDCDWDHHWVAVGGGWHNGWRPDERAVRRDDQPFRAPEVSRPWTHNPAKVAPVLPPQFARRAPDGGARPVAPVVPDHRGRLPGVPEVAPHAPAVPPAVAHTPEPVARPASPGAGAFGQYQSHAEVQHSVDRAQQSHVAAPTEVRAAPAPAPVMHSAPPAAPAHEAPSAPAFRPSESGSEVHAESARGNSSMQQQQPQQPSSHR
jgi:hypothetical protein